MMMMALIPPRSFPFPWQPKNPVVPTMQLCVSSAPSPLPCVSCMCRTRARGGKIKAAEPCLLKRVDRDGPKLPGAKINKKTMSENAFWPVGNPPEFPFPLVENQTPVCVGGKRCAQWLKKQATVRFFVAGTRSSSPGRDQIIIFGKACEGS